MLKELHIKNFAIIDNIHIEFSPGLNVLTGETGTGKSIIIDALELVLGERSRGNEIRHGAKKAEIEAIFSLPQKGNIKNLLQNQDIDVEEDEIFFKRTLSQSGKNRCFINGSLVNQSFLKNISSGLIDIHGQHEHQSLLDKRSHVDILDLCTGLTNKKEEMGELFDEYKKQIDKYSQFARQNQQQDEKKKYLQLTIDDISQAKLYSEEEQELQKELLKLKNAEKLLTAAQTGYERIYTADSCVLSQLKHIATLINEASTLDSSFKPYENSINTALIDLKETALGLRDYTTAASFSPARNEEVQNRLQEISTLKRKYKVNSVSDLLLLFKDAKKNLATLDTDQGKIDVLKKEIYTKKENLQIIMIQMDKNRKNNAPAFEKKVKKELEDLNMPAVTFEVNFVLNETTPPDAVAPFDANNYIEYEGKLQKINRNGFLKIEFLFSSSYGIPPSGLTSIASGGEISRLMLVLKKILAHNDHIPSMVFDEIDSGCGGESAEMIGIKLKDTAQTHQILCITHLPQIAGKADTHFKIDKISDTTGTKTAVSRLTQEEKIIELARMSGRRAITKTTLKHAKEMME